MSEQKTPQRPQRFLPHYDKGGIDCGMCIHAELDDRERLICGKHKWKLSVQFVREVETIHDCGPSGKWFERRSV